MVIVMRLSHFLMAVIARALAIAQKNVKCCSRILFRNVFSTGDIISFFRPLATGKFLAVIKGGGLVCWVR